MCPVFIFYLSLDLIVGYCFFLKAKVYKVYTAKYQ